MQLVTLTMKEANALLGRHYLGPVTFSPQYCLADETRSAVAVYAAPVAQCFKGNPDGTSQLGRRKKPSKSAMPGALELTRLYKVPDAAFETSQFLAATLRWLRANTNTPVVFSYADPATRNKLDGRTHHGGIYRATGFTWLGESRATDKWRTPEGKVVSAPQCFRMKDLRTKSRKKIAEKRPDWVLMPGEPKILYVFPLRKRLGALRKVLEYTRYAAHQDGQQPAPPAAAG